MRKFKRLTMTLALLIAAVGGAWAQSANPEVIELKPDETGKNWFLADMPASNIELQVEYYPESNLFLSKEALADKANIAVTAGELGVQFDEDGKSANPVTEGTAMTVKFNGTKKILGMKVAKYDAALNTPLTIEALTDGNIVVNGPKSGMQYSLNGGAKAAVTTDAISVKAGDKVQFYGNGTSITSYRGTQILGSGDGFTCKVYGNIMSLVDEENFATAAALTETYAFTALFTGNTTLTDASGLLLPAETMTGYCYSEMFKGCTALTAAPALPATQLGDGCYHMMFQNCRALTAAPELPATTLTGGCYNRMFAGCTNLTSAPELKAEKLVGYCYQQMFDGCSKLASVTIMATSGFSTSNFCTYNWLRNAGTEVEGTKTVYTFSTANWPSGAYGIPDGWNRKNMDK